MIAQIKFCELVLKDPQLLASLIRIDNGSLKPDSIIRGLQRKSPTLRRSAAFLQTLKDAGYTDEEIYESETAPIDSKS